MQERSAGRTFPGTCPKVGHTCPFVAIKPLYFKTSVFGRHLSRAFLIYPAGVRQARARSTELRGKFFAPKKLFLYEEF
jgi:hypothetical protein